MEISNLDWHFFDQHYTQQKKSIGAIAKELNTYPKKIERIMIKLGYPRRSKSEAQKAALATNRSAIPTEGKHRTDEEKAKIGKGQYEYWQNLDDDTKQQHSEQRKENWANQPKQEREANLKKSQRASQKTAQTGSKLERFFLEQLLKKGLNTIFHGRHMFTMNRLETDLFIPKLRTVIEIDGEAHYSPLYGEESLRKTQRADMEKNSIVLNGGCCMIRVRQTKNSLTSFKILFNKVWLVLEQIRKEFPTPGNRFFKIEL